MRPVSPALRPAASAKLFVFGATIGPIVDSFHNQCLLRYDFAPITLPWPEPVAGLAKTFEQEYLLCSSWSVPLLLGFAYVVLGDILPRVFQVLLSTKESMPQTNDSLQAKAIVAVLTTAAIIKLSQFLELHQPLATAASSSSFLTSGEANYAVLLSACLLQWTTLDGTIPALLAAAITSIGGPLSELPFVANGFWHYIPQAADYHPLANVADSWGILSRLLGDNYQGLALSGITGPCYFAVTLDAIALGRWFQTISAEEEEK